MSARQGLQTQRERVGVSDRSEKSDDKRQRFRALAESRTSKAIEAISRIGNLSNRQIYEFEPSEVRKIIRALKSAVSAVESRFEAPSGKSSGIFKL